MDTGAEGGNLVFVKVRETYDLHTIRNKMTVISIHTPKPTIIKRNFPGLLMQCKAYRPVSCDVRMACASVQALDPLGVGVSDGEVSPEDVFNPILYRAVSNKGMSQLDAWINSMSGIQGVVDVSGQMADVDTDSVTGVSGGDDFNLYYGLLSNAHDWKHAAPQAGLSMSGLRPLVYDVIANVGDTAGVTSTNETSSWLPVKPGHEVDSGDSITKGSVPGKFMIGKAKEFPFLNCTSFTAGAGEAPGFDVSPKNNEQDVPYLPVVCACICVPPSRNHTLYYRMVVEWTLEFTAIRPLSEITSWLGLSQIGSVTHFMDYSYETTKKAITGSDETILDHDTSMVSANVDVEKVM